MIVGTGSHRKPVLTKSRNLSQSSVWRQPRPPRPFRAPTGRRRAKPPVREPKRRPPIPPLRPRRAACFPWSLHHPREERAGPRPRRVAPRGRPPPRSRAGAPNRAALAARDRACAPAPRPGESPSGRTHRAREARLGHTRASPSGLDGAKRGPRRTLAQARFGGPEAPAEAQQSKVRARMHLRI